MPFSHLITAVITTSPIPSHPSTRIIDQAYNSIRQHLPEIPILILADGVRDEQQVWTEKYKEYLSFLKQKERYKPDTHVIQFPIFMHQAGMLREVLKKKNDIISTPLILWIEHDFYLLPEVIDWPGIVETLLDNEVTSVRFSTNNDNYAKPPFEREAFISQAGIPLRKTIEYLSFPNIARRELYDAFMPQFQTGRTHIECGQTRSLTERDDGRTLKLSIYNPPLRRRVGCLNGRVFEDGFVGPKFPMVV